MCFLQRCRIKNERHQGDQMYREMNNEDVEGLNDIIDNLRAKTKQKIKQNMKNRFKQGKQAIKKARGRNAKYSNIVGVEEIENVVVLKES